MVGGTKLRNFRSCTCDLNSRSLTQWILIVEPFRPRFSYLVLDWLFVLSTTHTSVQQDQIILDLFLLIWLRVQQLYSYRFSLTDFTDIRLACSSERETAGRFAVLTKDDTKEDICHITLQLFPRGLTEINITLKSRERPEHKAGPIY
jgi:hypothetical protein